MAQNLTSHRRIFPGHQLPEECVKSILIRVLYALDFLHSKAKVIHTDLHPKNILVASGDKTIFSDLERDEMEHPSARKVDGDRVIYESRELGVPKKLNFGQPMICDFGEARNGADSYDALIQPFLYRAPKWFYRCLGRTKWTWSVGMMAWHLMEGDPLFDTTDADGKNSSVQHVAEMCALLGPPPGEFLRRSPIMFACFDENYNLKTETDFFAFMRKILQWVPEDRQSAKELLSDPWLRSGVRSRR
ncbi:uncharacterized protein FIBRA_08782 [Fibroporia radiculosa]|uniref:Protein kinase domain-containing protein n=1 Tax=Fibroporia radiculosa TaxID=599839 RepID=J4ICJ3_9APHY|nr:uncharacterized protein FIBRA_08782 [Fibroporia radiculosa]CCM06511.1 predicted protein [Fibroporia radiculosa]